MPNRVQMRDLAEEMSQLVAWQMRVQANVVDLYFQSCVEPFIENPVLAQINPFVWALQQGVKAAEAHPFSLSISLPFAKMSAPHQSAQNTLDKMPKNVVITGPVPKITEAGRARARSEHAKTSRNPETIELKLHRNPAVNQRAWAEVLAFFGKQHKERDFNITSATINGKTVDVKEKIIFETPFTEFVLFDTGSEGETILFQDPISGHPSSLISNPVQYAANGGFRAIAPRRKDIMDIPSSAGRYGLEEHTNEYKDILRILGPNIHLIPICQPIGATMAAVAQMATEEGFEPDSLHSFGAPFDNHAGENELSQALQDHPRSWSERHMKTKVPFGKKGAGRDIFWGENQIGNFIMMNPAMHINNLVCGLFNAYVEGDQETIDDIKAFARPFLSSQSISWDLAHDTEFMLFRDNLLARGELELSGERVDLRTIKNMVIHTSHGITDEKGVGGDDITTEATHAALHAACPDVMDNGNSYHTRVPGKGHYGPWEGSAARNTVFPRIFTLIHQIAREKGRDPGPLLDTQGNPIEPVLPEKFDPALYREIGAKLSVPGRYHHKHMYAKLPSRRDSYAPRAA